MRNVAVLERDGFDNVALLDRDNTITSLVGSEGADTAVLAVTTLAVDGAALVGVEGADTSVATATMPNLVTGGGTIPTSVDDGVSLAGSEGADTGTVAASASTSATLAGVEGGDGSDIEVSDLDEAAARVALAGSEGEDTGAVLAAAQIDVAIVCTEGADVGALQVSMVETNPVVLVATEGADTAVALASTRELGASLVVVASQDVETGTQTTVQVTVRDQFGQTVAGYPVVFSSLNSLVALIYDGAKVTNASGVATATVNAQAWGSVTLQAQVGSYSLPVSLYVHDQILNVGDSISAVVSIRDINGRPRRGDTPTVRTNKPGIISVSGLGATGTNGTDAFTITGVSSGVVEWWLEANGRKSPTYRIKVN